MAIGVKALPITFVAHAVAIVAAIMVLVWCLGFRGGLAWEDTNKNLIFNGWQKSPRGWVPSGIFPIRGGSSTRSTGDSYKKATKWMTGFNDYVNNGDCAVVADELDSYLDEKVISRMEDFNILSWWKTNANRYPTLARIARDILAIPITTVASESAFNTSGRVLHPVLMLIGLIIIGGEAIMSYKGLNLRKEVKKVIHLVLHAIALILGIIGIYAAFKYHNESAIVNLYSLHSWLGIAVISLYGIQWLYGFVIFFYPGGSTGLRSESLPWHVLFGLFVYILAVANAAIGFLEKLTFLENSGLAKYGSEALLVNFTAVITILYGAFVIFSVASQGPAEDDYSYSAI
ncbi:transmembrane ascorbate ferrireductase 1 [Citrus sinensis]|uniref:Transmembrane ascorbate ferrireductase 1 n=5 Tax=Citrus sinensis TaxID=2711 RepID=A0ACB8HSV4_CITSI|nr:transmembrane ascorbate ferrireductase 1 [Citrus sinensis]